MSAEERNSGGDREAIVAELVEDYRCRLRAIGRDPEGRILVYSTRSLEPNVAALDIWEVDPEGGSVVRREPSGEFGGKIDYLARVAPTPDGGFFVADNPRPEEPSQRYQRPVFVARVSFAGKILWEATFSAESPHNSLGTWVLELAPDGGCLVAGSPNLVNDEGGVDDRKALLLKIDADGRRQWLRTFGAGPGHRSYYTKFVVPASGGGWVAVGRTWEPAVGGSGSPYWYRTDGHGDLLWEQTLHAPNRVANAVRKTGDEGYIVAGQSYGEETSEGLLIKLTVHRERFLRGDSNDDGDVNIADPIFVLTWLFGGGPSPADRQSGRTRIDEGGRLGAGQQFRVLRALRWGSLCQRLRSVQAPADSVSSVFGVASQRASRPTASRRQSTFQPRQPLVVTVAAGSGNDNGSP